MKVIIIKEKSNGNESVGDMWLETKSFDLNDTLEEVLKWHSPKNGKLIISIDDSTEDKTNF
jgi:hypothetical protein